MDANTFLMSMPDGARAMTQYFIKMWCQENDIGLPEGYDSKCSFDSNLKNVMNMQDTLIRDLDSLQSTSRTELIKYSKLIQRNILQEGPGSIQNLNALSTLTALRASVSALAQEFKNLSSSCGAKTSRTGKNTHKSLRPNNLPVQKTHTTKSSTNTSANTSRFQKKWTEKESEIFEKLYYQKASVPEMMECLPRRSKNAIESRIYTYRTAAKKAGNAGNAANATIPSKTTKTTESSPLSVAQMDADTEDEDSEDELDNHHPPRHDK